ncbi:hypothetical protein HRG_010536 [Hirsutella rhossiliensis]|uniref:Uncharacterized protein n=1 Tax=Hirsutella rhossiliensis TaxID=111463 RepID=A0A9P8SEB9_9HYPO|nr:uncharacterized protein HRG_10536 [Hirsutella rhossiliensis]KAH0958235.1 hypothetical protein HRG_10536 [Hirsutella rhossiliensis]
MNHDQGTGAFSRNFQAVLQSFRSLTGSLIGHDDSTDLRRLLPRFEDETARFKMWSGSLGAHQSGRASLDHRLRETPHLREQVIYLLQDFPQTLLDTLTLLYHEQPYWQKFQASEHELVFSKGDLNDSDDSRFSDSDNDYASPGESLSTICTDVGEATDCLLRLSVAIANPAPHERAHRLGTCPLEDISFYEKHDIRNAQDKFPNMSTELAEILGKPITRRRQYFKYRKTHMPSSLQA